MTLRGRDEFENLSAAGTARAAPPVRFGEFSVPRAVAWTLQPTGKGPRVRAEFEMRRGRPFCVSVTIESTSDGRGVTTTDLAMIPGLERKALDAFRQLGVRVIDDDAWRSGENLDRTSQLFNPDRKAIAAALAQQSDDELRRVAEVYRANVDQRPVDAVSDALGGVSRATASRRIREARDRGFLPTTSQGKRNA